MKEYKKNNFGCLIVFIVLTILAVIGFWAEDKKTSSNSIPEDYDWVIGVWTCRTPYGIITYSLGKNGSFFDNEGREGSYTVEDGRIYTHLNGTIGFAIEIDERNLCISPGGGYWMTKVIK